MNAKLLFVTLAIVSLCVSPCAFAAGTVAQIPISIGWVAGQNPDQAIVSMIGQTMTVQAIVGRVETANGSAATVTVKKTASGTACSVGTALHIGSFDANGTPATNQALTLVGGATDLLAVGDSICVSATGGSNWAVGSAIGTITIFATYH